MTEFKVFIRWGKHEDCGSSTTDGAYRYPALVRAEDHDDAARKRLDILAEPHKYDGLVVVGHGKARVYEIRPVEEVEVVQV